MNILIYSLFVRSAVVVLLVLFLNSGFAIGAAQQSDDRINDTIRSRPEPAIRIGFDVSSLARSFIEPEVRQLEFFVDSEIVHNWFAIVEGGVMNAYNSGDDFIYQADGYFARAGVDYNFMKSKGSRYNSQVTAGMRYAYGYTRHDSPFFLITNPYWGNFEGVVEKSSYSLHWFEFSGGLKTEVWRNLYLGWSVKARLRIWGTRDPELNPYYLPGFGHSSRRSPIMLHYYISYQIGW